MTQNEHTGSATRRDLRDELFYPTPGAHRQHKLRLRKLLQSQSQLIQQQLWAGIGRSEHKLVCAQEAAATEKTVIIKKIRKLISG